MVVVVKCAIQITSHMSYIGFIISRVLTFWPD